MSAAFRTTKWSLILAAREGSPSESGRALQELCEGYWYPLYVFVRSQGLDPDKALDATQGYFLRLLEKDYLQQVDPTAGRFRSFLVLTMKHYLINEGQRERALKRGGGARLVSLDAEEAEDRYRLEPVDRLTPEQVYERRWALTVLSRSLAALRRDFIAEGKERRFDLLKGYLTGEGPQLRYGEVAKELNLKEPAVRAAVRRLRQRFGERLRAEIAETVSNLDQIDDEVRHLLQTLGQKQGHPK